MKRPTARSANDPSRAPACDRKVRYNGEVGARKVGQARLRENGETHKLWPYACARCRGWHLTSMPQSGTAITPRQKWEGIDDARD